MSAATHNKLKLGLAKSRRRQLATTGATADALSKIDTEIENLSDRDKAAAKLQSERRDAMSARFGTLDDRFHTDGFKTLAATASDAAENVGEYVHRSAQDKINAGLSAHRTPKSKNNESRIDWDGSLNESTSTIQTGLDEMREDI